MLMADAPKRPRASVDDADAAQKKQKVADKKKRSTTGNDAAIARALASPGATPAIDLTEDASPREKKCVEAIGTIAKEFICPITHARAAG